MNGNECGLDVMSGMRSMSMHSQALRWALDDSWRELLSALRCEPNRTQTLFRIGVLLDMFARYVCELMTSFRIFNARFRFVCSFLCHSKFLWSRPAKAVLVFERCCFKVINVPPENLLSLSWLITAWRLDTIMKTCNIYFVWLWLRGSGIVPRVKTCDSTGFFQ